MVYKKILKALYDYEGSAEDELSFNESDLLGINDDENQEESNDGWYHGCNLLGQSENYGFIPKTYCEEVRIISMIIIL